MVYYISGMAGTRMAPEYPRVQREAYKGSECLNKVMIKHEAMKGLWDQFMFCNSMEVQ